MGAVVSQGQGRGSLGEARKFVVLGVILGGEVVDIVEGPGGGWSPKKVGRLKGIILRYSM